METDVIESVVMVLHVLAAVAIIFLVLIQQGKGADMGSGLGAGASSTVFGSGGAGNFLTRATTWIAVGFFLTSFALAYVAKEKSLAARNIGIPQIETTIPAGSEVSEVPQIEVPVESDVPALEEE